MLDVSINKNLIINIYLDIFIFPHSNAQVRQIQHDIILEIRENKINHFYIYLDAYF